MPKIAEGRMFLLSQNKLCRAASLINQGEYQKAIKYLAETLRLEPRSGNAYYLYGKCLALTGHQQQSKAYLDEAFVLNPCFFETHSHDLQKIALNISELYEEAKQCLQASGKTNNFKWQQVIDKFAKKKDLNTSFQILKLFQSHKKQNNQYSAHLFSTIGITYYQIGLYEQSQRNYDIALQMRSNQYRYYNNSAILQYIFNNYQRSQELVEKSLSLNQGYAKSLFIVSFSLCKVGRIQQAVQKIKSSIEKDNNSVMYRMKKITILLTYFPEKTTEIINQLTQTIQIINGKKDGDTYFSNKDNIPLLKTSLKFLLQNIQYREAIQQDWKLFVSQLDDFLIRGHYDKYKITKNMMNLINKMKDILKEFQLIPAQQEKKVQQNLQLRIQSNDQIQNTNPVNFDSLF